MNTELLAHWLIFVGLLWFSVWLHRQWVRLRHDHFRFRLFEVRDGLYNLVADGALSSTDKIFVEFRDRINSTLRTSEDIGAQDLIISLVRSTEESDARKREFVELFKSAPPLAESELKKLANRFATATVDILFFNSNFLKLARILAWLTSLRKGGNTSFASVDAQRLIKKPETALPRPLRKNVPAVRAVRAIRTSFALFL